MTDTNTTTSDTPWDQPHGRASDLDAQREYARVLRGGRYRFAAHGDGWHWFDPGQGLVYSRRRHPGAGLVGPVLITRNVNHTDWILEARRAIRT